VKKSVKTKKVGKKPVAKAKKTVDPRQIFEHASRFLGTDQFLRRAGQPGSGWELTIAAPTMVLSAFAAELYLKCLLVMQSGSAPPIHQLDKLFKQLNHKTQRRIQELWEADGRPKLMPFCTHLGLPSDLSNALAKCGRAFENLRYYYEDPTRVVYYIGDFAWIVMRVIVEIKPEWKPPEPPAVPSGSS
jgi:hypothetical protein